MTANNVLDTDKFYFVDYRGENGRLRRYECNKCGEPVLIIGLLTPAPEECERCGNGNGKKGGV